MLNLTSINPVKAQDGAFLAVGGKSFNACIDDLNIVLKNFSAKKLTLQIGSIPLNDKKINSAPIMYSGKAIGNIRIIKSRQERKRKSSRNRIDRGVDYPVGASIETEFLVMGYFNIVKSTTLTAKRNSDAMRDTFVSFARTYLVLKPI